MKDSEQRFLDYWGQKRTQGAIKFSIVTGIVYGVFVALYTKRFDLWCFVNFDRYHTFRPIFVVA